MKTEISQSDYYKLLGLKSLADEHVRWVSRLVEAAARMTGEVDELGRRELGHCADLMWDEAETVANTLRKMKITVVPEEEGAGQ